MSSSQYLNTNNGQFSVSLHTLHGSRYLNTNKWQFSVSLHTLDGSRYLNTNKWHVSVSELSLQRSLKLFASSNVSWHRVPTHSTQKWLWLLALCAWKANSRSSDQEIARVLSNFKTHYRVPNSSPLDSTPPRHPIPVYIFALYYPSIYAPFFQDVSYP